MNDNTPAGTVDGLARYYVKTGYHYWQVIDRETECSVGSSYSAHQHKGDQGAREAARKACNSLNNVARDKNHQPIEQV